MGKRVETEHTLLEIEHNIGSRRATDRIMWFSMWAVLSIASFGIAWFPMIYYLIKRRNEHFSRQAKLEELILNRLEINQNSEKTVLNHTKQLPSKNLKALTISTILVVPAFYVFYFLRKDLNLHEEHEHDFLANVISFSKEKDLNLNIQGFVASPKFSSDRYIILSIVTFGLVIVYWLYRIFNDYNSHFRMQWLIEDELLRFFKEVS